MKKLILFSLLALLIFTGKANSQITVSGSNGLNATYTSFTKAGGMFAAFNSGGSQSGMTITVAVTADVANEDGVNSLNAGLWTSMTISPTGGASRTISGTVSGAMITFNGADNLTIDGLNSGGNALTISNLSTGGTAATIKLQADAQNNTITKCTILGSSTAHGTATIHFGASSSVGNNGNNVNNCNIGPAGSNLPLYAIYSAGINASFPNSNNTIDANNVYDWFSTTVATIGIFINTESTTWTITNNRLYQTATRTYTSAFTQTGIKMSNGTGYTITGNTIGFANSSGTGTTNIVGNSVALTGFPSSYTASGTANTTRYIAIDLDIAAGGTASSVQNNTIGGFALYTSSGASTTNGIFCGIRVLAGNVNIGTTTGNTIGSTTGTGSIYTACTSTGGTIVGIYATSVNTLTIQNNTIGACDASGTTSARSGGFTGIEVGGTGGTHSVTSNTIGNSTADNIRTGYFLSAGNLSNAGTATSTTGATGAFVGIRNTATGSTSSITGNTLRGWNICGTVTTCTGITSGANTTSSIIDGNFLGTAALGWVRYAFANSGSLTGISASPAAAATLSISTNDFRGIVNTTGGTQAQTYITVSHAASTTSTINGNTFTNLAPNFSGAGTFIARGSNMTATGTTKVINNSIVTGYNKGALGGGQVTVYAASGNSVTGSAWLDTNNNFSNITLAGSSSFTGWSNIEGASTSSGPTKVIRGNVISNVSGGSGTYLGMSINSTGTSLTCVNNTISGFTCTGATVTGILLGASNSLTGTYNVSHNKILNIEGSNAAGLVSGMILSSGGATFNVYNNIVGDLRNPTGSNGTTDVIRGISITSAVTSTTINLSNNTVYLNASAGGTNFTTSALFVTTQAVATTAALVTRNNIFINASLAQGTGIANAHRRSSTTLTNFSATSNKNNYYSAGTGTHNLFYDGTNSITTLGAYITLVSARDANSFSENTTFKSTSSASADFMKVDETVITQCESNGIVVSGITDDKFFTPRYPNVGFPENISTPASAPDIGAYEFGALITAAGSVTIATGTYTNAVISSLSTATNLNGCTINGVLTVQSGTGPITGAITYGSGATINYTGSGSFTTGSEITGTVPNVILNNSGGVVLNSSTTISNLLTLTSGTLTVGANTLTLSNPITGTPTNLTTDQTSGLIINGSAANIHIPSSVTQLDDLEMNNSNIVIADGNIRIRSLCAFTNGVLNMGANTLEIGHSTALVGSLTRVGGGVVRGAIKRWFATTAQTTNTIFPVSNYHWITGQGFGDDYNEVAISFTTGGPAAGGSLTVRFDTAGSGTLFNNGGLGYIDVGAQWPGVNFINLSPQYWTITPGDGLAGFTYNISLIGNGMNLSTVATLYTGIVKRTNNTQQWAWSFANHVNTSGSTTPVLGGTGFTTFSEFAVGGNGDNLLPVELSSFTSSVSGKNVTLNWSTITETNNSGFDIERKSSSTEWKKIGFTEGHGTTNELQNYSFTDIGLNTGNYNYRLKQIDYNGNFGYHDLSGEVIIGIPTKYSLAQNYPNPFNPSTIINYQLAVNSFVSLKIYDMTGKEVSSLVNEVKNAGYYSVTFDAKNLSSGMYFYKLSTDKFSDVKKMVVVK